MGYISPVDFNLVYFTMWWLVIISPIMSWVHINITSFYSFDLLSLPWNIIKPNRHYFFYYFVLIFKPIFYWAWILRMHSIMRMHIIGHGASFALMSSGRKAWLRGLSIIVFNKRQCLSFLKPNRNTLTILLLWLLWVIIYLRDF